MAKTQLSREPILTELSSHEICKQLVSGKWIDEAVTEHMTKGDRLPNFREDVEFFMERASLDDSLDFKDLGEIAEACAKKAKRALKNENSLEALCCFEVGAAAMEKMVLNLLVRRSLRPPRVDHY